MRQRWFVVPMMVSLLAPLATVDGAWAEEPGPHPPGNQLYGTHVITGRVTSAATGAGLEGICVLADAGGVPDDPSPWMTQTLTTVDGRYVLLAGRPLEGGSIQITFVDCHLDPTYVSQRWHGGEGLPFTAVPSVFSGIDAVLTLRAEIAGTVTDFRTGAAMPGICVTAGGPETFYALQAATDATGHYMFRPDAGTGTVSVQFGPCPGSAWCYFSQWYHHHARQEDADPVAVTSGAVTTVDETVSTGAVVDGVVVDRTTGAPLAGIEVTMKSDTGRVVSRTTAADGTYRFDCLLSGTYTVRFNDPSLAHATQWWNGATSEATADPVTLDPFTTLDHIDAALQ